MTPMNTRKRLRSFLFAVTTAGISLLLYPAAFAADPRKPTAQSMGHDKKCKKYVREYHGHPGKGARVVKIAYGECATKR